MNVYKTQLNYITKRHFTIIFLLCSFYMCMGQSPEKQNVVTGIDFSGCDLGSIKSIKFTEPEDIFETPTTSTSEAEYLTVTNWEFLMKKYNLETVPDFSKVEARRFYIEVKLSASASNTVGDILTGNLLSLSPDFPNSTLDQISDIQLMKLTLPGFVNTYRSKPLLLVSDNDIVDDNFDEQPTTNPPPIDDPTIDNTDDEGIDLTIYGIIGGKLKMSYSFDNSTKEKEINICDPSEPSTDFQLLSNMDKEDDRRIKKVKLNLISLIDPETNLPYFEKSEIMNEIKNVQDTYGQVCVQFVNTDMTVITEDDIIEETPPEMNGSYIYLDDGIDIGGNMIETPEMAFLIDELKDSDSPNWMDKIDVFFGGKADNGMNRGVALIDNHSPSFIDISHVRTVFIVKNGLRPQTLAHELGHVLTNKGHYVGEDIPGTVDDYDDPNPDEILSSSIKFQNLMRNSTSVNNGVFGSKRLWIFQIWYISTNTNLLHY